MYINSQKYLTGEYAEAFNIVEKFACANDITITEYDEELTELIDSLLSAQKEDAGADSVIGNDIESFCRAFFPDKKKTAKQVLSTIIACFTIFSMLTISVCIFDVFENQHNKSLINARINFFPFLVFIVFFAIFAFVSIIISKKTVFSRQNGSVSIRDNLMYIITALAFFISFTVFDDLFSIFLPLLCLLVPALIIFAAGIVYFFIEYKKVPGNPNEKIELDEQNESEVFETAGICVTEFNLINQKRRKHKKPEFKKCDYISLLEKRAHPPKWRKILLYAVIALIAVIILTVSILIIYSGELTSVRDGILWGSGLAIAITGYSLPIYLANRIKRKKYRRLLETCRKMQTDVFSLYEKIANGGI